MWSARQRCRCHRASRCHGPRASRAAGGHSFPSWTWTRWETASPDQRRRRPTRHLQGGRPGLRLQHLPGRAHPALRGARAAPQGAGLSRGRVAVPGRRGPARRPPQAARHRAPHREETRTVILEWEGGKLGVVVDAVTEVLQVAATEVTAPPNIVKGLAAEYITGIVVKD